MKRIKFHFIDITKKMHGLKEEREKQKRACRVKRIYFLVDKFVFEKCCSRVDSGVFSNFPKEKNSVFTILGSHRFRDEKN